MTPLTSEPDPSASRGRRLRPPPHPTAATVDLEAFRHNLAMIRAYVGPRVTVMPVVKADAYGHGALRLSAEAVRTGIRHLAVARYHEGLALRQAGIEVPILVFESVPPEALDVSIAAGLTLTVTSERSAGTIAERGSQAGGVTVHIKVDTGMGRLGIPDEAAPGAIERIAGLRGLRIEGVYSHFATSEDPDRSFAAEQLRRFRAVLSDVEQKRIPVAMRHMANSGAIIAMPEAHLDCVRPGIMLYGYPPARGMAQRHPVRPVLALRSRVSLLKTVEAGTSISYGRRYVTAARTGIATIPIGYADGFTRLLTHRSHCLIRGRRFPIVGTICMDHVMADVGLNSGVSEGDTVTLIGRDGDQEISAWDIASTLGTIPYEVTCLITPRVPRLAASGGSAV